MEPVHLYIPIINNKIPEIEKAVIAGSDEEGLRAIAEQFTGYRLYCDFSLAEAGATLGFTPELLTSLTKCLRVDLALALAKIRFLDKLVPGIYRELLLQACGHFVQNHPWNTLPIFQLIELEVSGKHAGTPIFQTYEATISKPYPSRFTLYKQKGESHILFNLVEEGRLQEIHHIDRIMVSFETEEAFIISALQEAYGLSYLPKPAKLSSGSKYKIDEEDAFILSATMYAIVDLSNNKLVELSDGRIIAASRIILDDSTEILAKAWFGDIIELDEKLVI